MTRREAAVDQDLTEKYQEGVGQMTRAVLDGPGHLDPELRRAVEGRAAELGGRLASGPTDLPAALGPYVEKVAKHAYKVTDRDVEVLKTAGYTEDQIFEATIAAALGAANARLERGLTALQELSQR